MSSFAIVLSGILLRGIGNGIRWVFTTRLLMVSVRADMRERVFSTELAIFILATATSAASGSRALDLPQIDITRQLFILGGILLFFGFIWTLWLSRAGKKRH